MLRYHFKPFAAAAIAMAAIGSTHAAMPADSQLSAISKVYLDTNGCTPQLTEELQDEEFLLASSESAAQAKLKVDVHQLDASMGASARYSAMLVNGDGVTLFSTSGREDSISQEELCEDISDDVVDAMQDKIEDAS
ncbi:MAG: hypothetical protein R3352_08285 [Salinisphaeraceae bacterium]|nr:hypothetical protein [Salinisphaeraceae bacterium]